MENSDQEVYLGDIIDKSAKVKPNIEKRKCKGVVKGDSNVWKLETQNTLRRLYRL